MFVFIKFHQVQSHGDAAALAAFDAACTKLNEVVLDAYQTEDVAKVFEWMDARSILANQGVMHKLYQSFVEDVLHQKKDMPIFLTTNTKRADEALRRVAELEKKVSQLISNPERDEEALKGLLSFSSSLLLTC